MKKVILAQTIKDAHKKGQCAIHAPLSDFIITPAAASLAQELNIELIMNSAKSEVLENKQFDEALVRKIIRRIYERFPDAHSHADEIRKALVDVLRNYIR